MEAVLKIYDDIECENEIDFDGNKYVIPLKDLSSRTNNIYTRTFFVKNIGNFIAYPIKNQSSKYSIEIEKEKLNPNEVSKVILIVNITQNENIKEEISLKARYNHLENCSSINNTYADIKNRPIKNLQGLTYATLQHSLREVETDTSYNIFKPTKVCKTVNLELIAVYKKDLEIITEYEEGLEV